MLKKICSLMVAISLIGGLLSVNISAVAADVDSNSFVALYISPQGNDSNDGSIEKPFATLEKARDTIRTLKSGAELPAGGATVYLREGSYNISQSFKLDENDSGTTTAPIVYRAYKDEKVSIVGGANLDAGKFTNVTDKATFARLPKESADKVLQISLKDMGITKYGEISKGKFNKLRKPIGYEGAPPVSELFVNGKVMTLSRYPNEGYMQMGELIDEGSNLDLWQEDAKVRSGYVKPEDRPEIPLGGIFKFTDDHIKSWTNAKDIWMRGYWGFDWYEELLGIEKIDFFKNTIKTSQASVFGFKSGQRFYCFNLLEELDAPGEWYLDRDTGILYFYPIGKLDGTDIKISLLDAPLLKMENASNVTIKGIIFESGRTEAIDIKDGENDLIYNCTVRFMAQKGILINGGKNHGVVGCEIYDTGMGGISITGGDSKTLEPAGHYAENNNIYKVDRVRKTSSDTIKFAGVGIRLSNNELHDMQNEAIGYHGNDCLIELNYIHDVVKSTQDAAAIYSGRSLTERGNVIKNNFIKNVISDFPGVRPDMVSAIYFDDQQAGQSVIGNIFYNVMNGVWINGGRDNTVEKNIFAKVHSASNPVVLSNWGATTGNMLNLGISNPKDSTTIDKLVDVGVGLMKKVPYDKAPYTKYPNLANMLSDEPALSKYNSVADNVFYKSTTAEGFKNNGGSKEITQEEIWKRNTIKNNISTQTDIGFVNEEQMNLALKPNAEVFSLVKGFEDIPFDKIGRYTDKINAKMSSATALFIGSPTANVNNQEKYIDEANINVTPIIKDSRTLVPVRFIAESFGAKVDWNGETSEITIALNGKTIKMTLGSNKINVNGNEKELDVAAQVINERTMIPLRALAESIGKQIFWDPRGLIIISQNEKLFDADADKSYINEIVRRVSIH